MSTGAADRPTSEQLVDVVLDAVRTGTPERARLALHPYLRWSDPSGALVRGRTQVLAMLTHRGPILRPPAAVELRDSQIYRWREPPA